MNLNLGCSDRHLDGYLNVDIAEPADEIVDLSKPWPWADNSIHEIVAADIIEHLPNKILTMNEAWRVLIPGGVFFIEVPTTDGRGAFQDPTHVSFWNPNSFLYFKDGDPHRERFGKAYGVRARFSIEHMNHYQPVAKTIPPADLGGGVWKLEVALVAVKSL